MDAQQKRVNAVLESASVAVAVLANPANGDFELVTVDSLPLPEDAARRFKVRGLGCFLGVIGISPATSGLTPEVRVALEAEISDELRTAVVKEFVRVYERAIAELERSLMGDTALWLAKLHQLPDTRPN